MLLRNETYYFLKRVPYDLKDYYSVKRLCFSLKTKSYSSALRMTKSVLQRLEDYWLGIRLQKMDAPALPIHDSFIMHHGFGTYGELEEAMRRTFYDRFHRDIKVKVDMVVPIKPTKDYPIGDKNFFADTSIDGIINAENDYSQWRDRDDMWMNRK